MTDCRKYLVKALRTALITATSLPVYTKVPVSESGVVPPYLFISDIYQSESGDKHSFYYEYDVLIQAVYRGLNDLETLYNTMNLVSGIIPRGGAPFALEGGFTIQQAKLINSSETEIPDDLGILNVGLIRIKFDIT